MNTTSRGSGDVSRVETSRPPDREAVYRKTPQGDLKLFVYLPADWLAVDRRPAIVFFFGGAWTNGSPRQFYRKGEYLASRGMVAFCAEYRVFGVHGTTMDRCVEDARSAMRYVRRHAAEWGVDSGLLVGSGGSAGGHLAACCALLDGPDDEDDDPAISCRPDAMVLFNPCLDTAGLLDRLSESDFARRVSGVTVGEKEKALATLSPVEHLGEGCPPTIVFYGTEDFMLDPAREFVRRSLTLGNRIELWTAEGMPHGFFNATPWHESTTRKADEFLASLGFLPGEAVMQLADEKAVLRLDPASGSSR